VSGSCHFRRSRPTASMAGKQPKDAQGSRDTREDRSRRLEEELEQSKKRSDELKAEMIKAQRDKFEEEALKAFAALAALFDTRVECVHVCDIKRLAYNAYSALDFGRGFGACEIARAELKNGYVIALDSGVRDDRPYFEIWRDIQTYELRKCADISLGTMKPKVAFERWGMIEGMVKIKPAESVDAVFRAVAKLLLDDVYIRQGYHGSPSTIAKPRIETSTRYTF
jgi:hypothetical protein